MTCERFLQLVCKFLQTRLQKFHVTFGQYGNCSIPRKGGASVMFYRELRGFREFWIVSESFPEWSSSFGEWLTSFEEFLRVFRSFRDVCRVGGRRRGEGVVYFFLGRVVLASFGEFWGVLESFAEFWRVLESFAEWR